MKKILSIVLSVILMLTILPTGLFSITASAATDGYYTYEASNGEATITDCKSSISGDITIPSELGGYPVTSIGEAAFSYCNRLESITIPDSVTSIGDEAFYYCYSLKNATIGNNVKSIGYRAFYKCTSLTNITIGDSVTSRGYEAFYDCNIKEITISKGSKTVNSTIIVSNSLKKVIIPDSVTSISDRAFYNCTSLTSITLPNSITIIGDDAFINCTSLTSITIPDSITSVGDDAFRQCTALKSIEIPDSVTSIGRYAFCYCTELKSISISKNITHIKPYTFYRCTSLTSITIPDGVTTLNDYVFYECSSLTRITIPASATHIGINAFRDCSSINSVYYRGNKTQKGNIYMSQAYLTTAATWYYDSCIMAANHTYTNNCDTTCNVCGDLRTTTHTYTNNCDTTCNVCNATRTTTHTYSNNCDKSCNVCGKTRTVGAHKYSNSCDATCNYCNAKRTVKHTYTNSCDTTCNVCKAKRTIKHTYSNNCDTSCNVCKATRTITHAYKTTTTKATLSKNGSIVKKCSVCGKKTTATVKYVKSITTSKSSYTYNGKVQKPTVTIKDSSGKILKKDTDYTLTYSSGCKNAGTYKVTIKMKGNYSGTKILYFKIKPLDISKVTVKLDKSKYYYTKKSVKATVTTINGITIPSSSVKYTYKNNVNVGTATVTVKASGNFTGTKTVAYKIYPKASETAITLALGVSKSFSAASSAKVKYTVDNSKIIKYSNGRIVALKPGTATIKATSNGVTTSVKVTVKQPYMSKTSVSAYSGHTFTLKIVDGSGKITWTSSNSKIAKVSSSGTVTPLKYGTCYIYATQNGKTYKCKVSVSKYYKGTKVPDFGALIGKLPIEGNYSTYVYEKYSINDYNSDNVGAFEDALLNAGFKYKMSNNSNGTRYYYYDRGSAGYANYIRLQIGIDSYDGDLSILFIP